MGGREQLPGRPLGDNSLFSVALRSLIPLVRLKRLSLGISSRGLLGSSLGLASLARRLLAVALGPALLRHGEGAGSRTVGEVEGMDLSRLPLSVCVRGRLFLASTSICAFASCRYACQRLQD